MRIILEGQRTDPLESYNKTVKLLETVVSDRHPSPH